MLTTIPGQLTSAQRRIVEWGDGPLVVIAGAGTGKTRVIVERVRWLLETKGSAAPRDEPLLPEHLLVLTYNVKAAKELQTRLDQAVGVAARSRMTVTNFHSFCQRIVTESAADAGLPPRPDVLDGVAQVLLLKDIRPQLPLVYHTDWWLGQFVQFINWAKDDLVSPEEFDAYVDEERRIFEARYGGFDAAVARLDIQGNLRPLRAVRGAYAGVRAGGRSDGRLPSAIRLGSGRRCSRYLAAGCRPTSQAARCTRVPRPPGRTEQGLNGTLGRPQSLRTSIGRRLERRWS